jgi:hypothetical protein
MSDAQLLIQNHLTFEVVIEDNTRHTKEYRGELLVISDKYHVNIAIVEDFGIDLADWIPVDMRVIKTKLKLEPPISEINWYYTIPAPDAKKPITQSITFIKEDGTLRAHWSIADLPDLLSDNWRAQKRDNLPHYGSIRIAKML